MPKPEKARKRGASVLAAPNEANATLLMRKSKRSSVADGKSPRKIPNGGGVSDGPNHSVRSADVMTTIALECLLEEKVSFWRSIQMLEDSARDLLAGEGEGSGKLSASPQALNGSAQHSLPPLPSPGAKKIAGCTQNADGFSTPEDFGSSDSDEVDRIVAEVIRRKEATAKQQQAVNVSKNAARASALLLFGSKLFLDRGGLHELYNATRLAERAVGIHGCPAATSVLAWSSMLLSFAVQDTSIQASLQASALEFARQSSMHSMQLNGGDLGPVQVNSNARNCWVFAILDNSSQAIKQAESVVSADRTRIDVLVLLALLHSCNGRYDYSLNVLQHAYQLNPHHIAVGLLLTVCKHTSGELVLSDEIEQELAVSLARAHSMDSYARGLIPTNDNAANLIGHSEENWSELTKLKHRAAGSYALIAEVAIMLKSPSIAELAIDAGLNLIASAPEVKMTNEHSALLVARANLWLYSVRNVQELHGHSSGSASAPFLGPSKIHVELRRLLDPSTLLVIQELLQQAIELSPGNADAYRLLGEKWFVSAQHPGLQVAEQRARYSKAAFELQTAIRCDMRNWEAYDTLGKVQEAQGALDISMDLLLCAAQLSTTAPIIPFRKFVFLLA